MITLEILYKKTSDTIDIYRLVGGPSRANSVWDAYLKAHVVTFDFATQEEAEAAANRVLTSPVRGRILATRTYYLAGPAEETVQIGRAEAVMVLGAISVISVSEDRLSEEAVALAKKLLDAFPSITDYNHLKRRF